MYTIYTNIDFSLAGPSNQIDPALAIRDESSDIAQTFGSSNGSVASLHSLSKFHLSFYCHENVQYFDLRWRRRDRLKHHNVTTNWNFPSCESLYTELYLFRYMIQRRVDSRLFYMRNVGLTSCFYTCFVMNKSRRFTMQCIYVKRRQLFHEEKFGEKYLKRTTHRPQIYKSRHTLTVE